MTPPNRHALPRRPLLLGGLAAAAVAALVAASPARSQLVTTSSSQAQAAQPSPNERLQRLVPESVGGWTRHSLAGARPGPDGQTIPAALAEFRKLDWRVQMHVGESLLKPPPPPATPSERRTGEGSERSYAEGPSTVRETVRSADGRVEVTLLRADGLVVSVQGIAVSPAELKALALAVRPLPPR